jgi:DNA-binding transcriptional ArsR family regulator
MTYGQQVTHEAVLDALADPTRRSIVSQLARGPVTVGELAERLPVSRPAVSQHLKVLLGAELVSFEARGTQNLYRLEKAGFDELRHWLEDFWQGVLDAFETYAESPHHDRKEDI